MNKTPRFGAHRSTAGGIQNAYLSAEKIGCDCLQIFVRNQRQWQAKPLTPAQIDTVREARQSSNLHPVVAHASYLINLASGDEVIRDKSLGAVVDEMQRCGQLGVSGYVIHPGAAGSDSIEVGMERIASALDEAQQRLGDAGVAVGEGGVRLLLEVTAGQGKSIGHRFEQIRAIIDLTRDDSWLGTCLDTCHMFAAGYELRTEEGYAETMSQLDEHIGIDRVHCIHMNDSKKGLGCRVDRHAHIGRGEIGLDGFAYIVNDSRFVDVPMILETPKEDGDKPDVDMDEVNLAQLRALAG